MRKICLGGTFNPIHHAHLICARQAAEAVNANIVVLIPANIPPHKQNTCDMASAGDRLQMCRLATEGLAEFEVDDREIRRGGPSYTLVTVRELKQEGWGHVNWLIGTDMIKSLPTWHQFDNLLRDVEFTVMSRPDHHLNWNQLQPELQPLRQRVVNVPQIEISATQIRRRVRQGLPIDFLTPPQVARYIIGSKLYSG